MPTKPRSHDPQDPEAYPVAGSNRAGSPGTRRYWLKAGVAAPTVLLTLASRPVFGSQCRTASAFASLNTSAAGRDVVICNGLTPEQWCDGYRKGERNLARGIPWPPPYVPVSGLGPGQQHATIYHSVETGLMGRAFGTRTLLEVLDLRGGDTEDLGRHIGAALLNARSGRTPMLDESKVRCMWNDYRVHRCYEPTAGVVWDASQIVAYLRSTMA